MSVGGEKYPARAQDSRGILASAETHRAANQRRRKCRALSSRLRAPAALTNHVD